jgi:hypothetical protein
MGIKKIKAGKRRKTKGEKTAPFARAFVFSYLSFTS